MWVVDWEAVAIKQSADAHMSHQHSPQKRDKTLSAHCPQRRRRNGSRFQGDREATYLSFWTSSIKRLGPQSRCLRPDPPTTDWSSFVTILLLVKLRTSRSGTRAVHRGMQPGSSPRSCVTKTGTCNRGGSTLDSFDHTLTFPGGEEERVVYIDRVISTRQEPKS